MQEREVKAKHQQLISGVCLLIFNFISFLVSVMECIIFMIHLLQLLVYPSGVYTVILVLHVHMGLHQLFVSNVICNNSVLHLWYVVRYPVFL